MRECDSLSMSSSPITPSESGTVAPEVAGITSPLGSERITEEPFGSRNI